MEQHNKIQIELIERAGKGDESAQAWLYRQYSKAMYNNCLRMTGNKQDAEDVLQEAFILAFRNIKQLKDPLLFGGWLRRIVMNECIRHSRRTFKMKDLEDDHYTDISDTDAEWWTDISLEQIHQEIKNLPAGCRQIFVLYVLEDYTHKNIAKLLNISEGTSKSQYHRARRILKQYITKKMI